MGKLDSIYKIHKKMNSINEFKGNLELLLNSSSGDLVCEGSFDYFLKEEYGNVDLTAHFNFLELKRDFQLNTKLNLSDFQNDEDSISKPSITTLLKIFSNLKIETDSNETILNAKLTKAMKNMKKDYDKDPITDLEFNFSDNEINNIKILAKFLTKKFFQLNLNDCFIKVTTNEKFEITTVNLFCDGQDSISLKINLIY
ncbi:MAG: hypothetical protein ACRDD2_06790 [Sarcina sp.]